MTSTSNDIHISGHAIQRWRERVDPGTCVPAARAALAQFLAHGHSRSTPRRWMCAMKQTPGIRFVYSADMPGVCVLVRDGTALTVVTRTLCQPACRAQRERRRTGSRAYPRVRPLQRNRSWSIEEAA
jgi:hypothetical protein